MQLEALTIFVLAATVLAAIALAFTVVGCPDWKAYSRGGTMDRPVITLAVKEKKPEKAADEEDGSANHPHLDDGKLTGVGI